MHHYNVCHREIPAPPKWDDCYSCVLGSESEWRSKCAFDSSKYSSTWSIEAST